MKKIAMYCLQLLAIVGVASLTSCGGSDTVTPVGTPTIKTENGATYTTKKFEKGEVVKVKVTAEIPGGVEIFQVWRKNGAGQNTQVNTFNALFPAVGATTYTKTFDITVAADEVVGTTIVYTFRVRNSSMTAGTFIEATYSYEVAAQGQGGGGGVAPLLRAIISVGLGAQTATEGSYLATALSGTNVSVNGATVTNGVFTTTQAGALTAGQKQAIDITFGAGNATGIAKTGADATHGLIMSPAYRDQTANQFNNPMGTDARATTFKTSTLTSLSAVTATEVNNLDHSTGTAAYVAFASGNPVYSFRNA
ncbi:MAG: hypothetical protein EAZ95_20450, partial [Bacteroidetes bacterium]